MRIPPESLEQDRVMDYQNDIHGKTAEGAEEPATDISETGENLMAKVLMVLEEINEKLETLEKNSKLDHDDQPFPKHKLGTYEPAWRAVYETMFATMKDKVDRWKSGMDSSLIFVGLFVTMITAFLVPVLQNLAPNPQDLTNAILANLTSIIYEVAMLNGMHAPSQLPQPEPFHPAISNEIVLLFLYAALLLSLITAIFSVFGRQWVEHLTKKPMGKTYKEKSLRLDRRDELANKFLKPILDFLHPILIISISFFIVGLLYQLWSISLTVDKSVTLKLTNAIGSWFVLCATLVTVGTVLHGGYCDESPFTMAMSTVIRRLIPKRFLEVFQVKDEWKELVPLFSKSIPQMDSRDNYDHVSTVRLFYESDSDVRDITKPDSLTIDAAVHFLESDASQKAKLTMAWNLLDLCLLEAEKNDYEKLGNALKALEKDTPSNQDKVRLTFFFVRMVLFLESNRNWSQATEILTADEDFLNKEDIKNVFMKVLALPGNESFKEKNEVARELVKMAAEDPHFLDFVKDHLFHRILNDDKTDFGFDWRDSIFRILPDDDVVELLRRISQKTEDTLFYFKILFQIFFHHIQYLPLPDDFDLLNFISFLSIDESRYFYLTGFYRSPTSILLAYCDGMDDALLSRQTGLPEFLEKVINDAPGEPLVDGTADRLLERIRRIEPVENSALPEQNSPSTSA